MVIMIALSLFSKINSDPIQYEYKEAEDCIEHLDCTAKKNKTNNLLVNSLRYEKVHKVEHQGL